MLSAARCRCYVVGKDVPDRIVYVTDGEAGQDHPALFSRTALLHSPQWVAGHGPQQLPDGLPMHCSFKARSGSQAQNSLPCFLVISAEHLWKQSIVGATSQGHSSACQHT